jgi:hypothetical protein
VWVAANIRVIVRDIPELAEAEGREVSPAASLLPLFITASGTKYDFWNVPFAALFDGTEWTEVPSTTLSAGSEWDQPFAVMVPEAGVAGGSFAILHNPSHTYFFFGD